MYMLKLKHYLLCEHFPNGFMAVEITRQVFLYTRGRLYSPDALSEVAVLYSLAFHLARAPWNQSIVPAQVD